ncbi:hypothetical protein BH10BDE1_BH10BDE1_32040 [soil metagenome]
MARFVWRDSTFQNCASQFTALSRIEVVQIEVAHESL